VQFLIRKSYFSIRQKEKYKLLLSQNPDRPWGPPSLLYSGYRVFSGSKAAGAWCWPPTPFQCGGQERIELYLYPPSRPVRPVTRTLYLLLSQNNSIFEWKYAAPSQTGSTVSSTSNSILLPSTVFSINFTVHYEIKGNVASNVNINVNTSLIQLTLMNLNTHLIHVLFWTVEERVQSSYVLHCRSDRVTSNGLRLLSETQRQKQLRWTELCEFVSIEFNFYYDPDSSR
jgi:hypothetical protein